MGSKIIAVIMYLLGFLPAAAQHLPPVALETPIIKETAVVENIEFPNSFTPVRVAIGDNAFQNYNMSEVGIFCTNDMKVTKYTVKDAPAKIECESGLLGVEGLKRAGSQALYRGHFEIVRAGDKFNLVNVIEVEEYLKGVVPNEMPVSFGLEALKAQSVAARNYVLSPRVKVSPNYDVVDSVAAQVYFGANTEKPLATQAIQETAGVVALYNGELILALYSSTAGGYTENYHNAFLLAPRPYLCARPDIISQAPLNTDDTAAEYYKSKPDAYDVRSPYFRWEREWEANELRSILKNITGNAEVKELRAKSRGESGKIVELEIVSTNGSISCVSKELAIRRLLTKDGKALPSANVVFEHEYDDEGKLVRVKAYGGGYGHGVGMSQYGAGFMGKELKIPYEKILQHYYTGVALGTKPVTVNRQATQTFYAGEQNAFIIIENKVSKLTANINGQDYVFDLGMGLFKKTAAVDVSQYIKPGGNTVTFYSDKPVKLYIELVEPVLDDIW